MELSNNQLDNLKSMSIGVCRRLQIVDIFRGVSEFGFL